MKIFIALAFAISISAQITPPQIGLPAAAKPVLVTLIDGKLVNVEIGAGLAITKAADGSYSISATATLMPPKTFLAQVRLSQTAAGVYPACGGLLTRNGVVQIILDDYTSAADGSIVTKWAAGDSVSCITIGWPGTQ